MRFNQGTRPMATDEQKAAVKPHIEKGAALFANLEFEAKKNADAKDLAGILEAVRDAGLISPFECRALKMEARTLFQGHEAALWAFHNKLVRRCVDLGIDVPPPADPNLVQPSSGGTR